MSARTRVGQTLAKRFRVDEILGTGGMGEVVGAFDLEREQAVAIKLMLPKEDEDSSEAQARFLQEARALRRLTSEHVVRIHDEGTLPDGTVYLVMERLEGHDLQRRLRKEAVPLAEAVGLILQACEALAEAHALGIVHRDLKPGNLFLARRDDGTIALKLLDFGISKMLPLSTNSEELLVTGVTGTLGTPQYMAPEQMMSAKDIDERADIWALGVNLYQMISRKHPFQSETLPELCALVLKEEPIPLAAVAPDLPAGLEPVVMRCLEKQPSRRYQTVRELMRALAPFAPELVRDITHLQVMSLPEGVPAVAAEPTPAPPVARRRTGWRWIVGGGLVGLGVTLALPFPSRVLLRDFVTPTIVQPAPAPAPAPPPATVAQPAPAPVAQPVAEPEPPTRRTRRVRESRHARAAESATSPPAPADTTSEAEILKEWK